jgi:hypothetical protein
MEAALDNALWDLDEARAAALVTTSSPADSRPVLVILPGNVIGPAIAAAYCAAAAGASVILKSPGVEQHLAPIVARQFDRLGAPLAGTIDARYWKGGDYSVEDALFAKVRRIVVLGSDSTTESVLQRAGGPPVVAYGTSFSVGFVAAGAELHAAARGAARDMCIFDQRGCMSPQTIYVEGGEARALQFAHALAAALREAGVELPRAHVDADEAAAFAGRLRQFAVTAIPAIAHGLDTIVLGPRKNGRPEFVVAVEPCGTPTLAGFGRIVSVMPCAEPPPIALAGPIDTLGFAGDRSALLDAVIAQLRDQPRPARICALGEMQRPPFGYRPTIENFT